MTILFFGFAGIALITAITVCIATYGRDARLTSFALVSVTAILIVLLLRWMGVYV